MTVGITSPRSFGVLYAAGADPHFISKNVYGSGTVLGVSLSRGDNNDDFITFLIRSGLVELDVFLRSGSTPFFIAINVNPSMAIMMMDYGADPRIRVFQSTALHQAIRRDSFVVVDRLLDELTLAKSELQRGIEPTSVWWLPTAASMEEFLDATDLDGETALVLAEGADVRIADRIERIMGRSPVL